MPGSRIFRFEDVEVDPAKSCVRRNGTELVPRAKVFAVLIYLLENRDRVVSREELLQSVWKRTFVSADVIVHCIAEIRSLLGDSCRNPRFVRTYPGTGYRFVALAGEVQKDGCTFPVARALVPLRRRKRWAIWAGVIASAIVLAALWVSVISRTPPGRGEAAWWRLDEGAGEHISDSSGYGNTGMLRNGAQWAPGRAGMAVAFDGVASYVEGRTRRLFPSGGAPRTATLWFRSPTTNGDSTILFAQGPGTAPYKSNFVLELTASGKAAAGYTTQQAASQRQRLDDDRWHLVAGVYEGAEANIARVFVDGVEQGETTPALPLSTKPGAPWSLGRNSTSGRAFYGLIADVRMYRQALTGSELMALYRCSSGAADLRIAERDYYFLPVFPGGFSIAYESQGEIRHTGEDYAGVEFARSDGLCSLESLRGAPLGQDVAIGVDLLTPMGAKGAVTSAGPYFRGRRAAPGDGILGGTSAGYWVQLHSTGVVTVRRHNPLQVVAFTSPAEGFDASRFHRLEAAARGERLEVSLDGRPLEFEESGRRVRTVSLPPVWNRPPAVGRSEGTAGIAFASEPRVAGTGQRARRTVVKFL